MRSAVLFPGLAPAGYAAIGDFLTADSAGRRRVAEADDVLGYSLLEEFRVGGLGDWPAADCAYLACLAALADHLPPEPPLVCAGLSFGGFGAAVYSGGLDYIDAVRLVADSAVEQTRHLAGWSEPAGCLFFYRIDHEAVTTIVDELRADGRWLELAADLGLGVYGVSASLATLELVAQRVHQRGGSAIYTMNRPQHCRALTRLRDHLAATVYPTVPVKAPRIPVVSDVDGSVVCGPTALREMLLDGWTEPVRTTVTVDRLVALGIERIYLVGPQTMFPRLLGDRFEVVQISPQTVPTEVVR